jgi:type I restriction enzyme, S subunit
MDDSKKSLPQGWRWARLREICDFSHGGTPSKARIEFWTGPIPWVSPKDMRVPVLNNGSNHISEEAILESSTTTVPEGTILAVVRSGILTRAFPVAIAGRPLAFNQDVKALLPHPGIVESSFLLWSLRATEQHVVATGVKKGTTVHSVRSGFLEDLEIPLPPIQTQKRIAAVLNDQMVVVERARAAAEAQLEAAKALPSAIVRQSFGSGAFQRVSLRDCLIEVSNGVGEGWHAFRLVGATREGIAPAKEGVGKRPERYKLVDAGTIFYNPMRILLGSIAFVDEEDEPAITSPDYVVFKTRSGVLHPRWFYYWLRSLSGDAFIRTLARGAVRERMLFRRLAAATIELPSWQAQLAAANRMRSIKALAAGISAQAGMINKLPAALLRRAFSGEL